MLLYRIFYNLSILLKNFFDSMYFMQNRICHYLIFLYIRNRQYALDIQIINTILTDLVNHNDHYVSVL